MKDVLYAVLVIWLLIHGDQIANAVTHYFMVAHP